MSCRILGTCNNFLYAMMLSGAYDILDNNEESSVSSGVINIVVVATFD